MIKTFRFLWIGLVLVYSLPVQAQEVMAPELMLQKSEVEAQLRFLASDALKGRRTGEEGNNIAAAYLAAHYAAHGLKPAPGMDSYFQPVNLEGIKPASTGTLVIGDESFEQQKDLLLLQR